VLPGKQCEACPSANVQAAANDGSDYPCNELVGKTVREGQMQGLNEAVGILQPYKEKFDWDNEELNLSEAKVLPEMVTPHHDVLAEMPGVQLESDFVSDTAAVQQPPAPTQAQRAAHVLRVSGLAGTTGVLPKPRQTTGVIDLSKDSNDGDNEGDAANSGW